MAIHLATYAVIPVAHPHAVYAVAVLSAISLVSFPAVSGLKSNNVTDSQQGSVQGALYGARALAQGLGPLLFGSLLKWSLGKEHYYPGLVLSIAAGGGPGGRGARGGGCCCGGGWFWCACCGCWCLIYTYVCIHGARESYI